ncbi:MAG: hypothetical protein GKR96_12765 [Gammaproteobacteria bacterium]|nr:hypothetical protein [Gammaproteobacteria bacterium]
MVISDTKNKPQYKLAHRLTGAIVLMLIAILVIPQLLKEPDFNADFTHTSAEATSGKESTIKIFKSKIAPVSASNLEKTPSNDALVSVVVPQQALKKILVNDGTSSSSQASTVTAALSTNANSTSDKDSVKKITEKSTSAIIQQETQQQANTQTNQASKPALSVSGNANQQSSTSKKISDEKIVLVKQDKKVALKANIQDTQNIPQKKVIKSSQPAVSKKAIKLPENKKADQWAVRVGTFSKESNVTSVSKLLNGNGLVARTTRVKTSFGDATRIWLGPYADKKSAKTISTQLKKLTGENGYITKHSP